MKNLFNFLLLSILLPTSLLFSLSKMENPSLEIEDKILTNINGKNISVVDVMKKMNQLAHEYYPEEFKSLPFRYQFYLSSWKNTFQEMIYHELILTDASAKEIKVTDAEVHEELQKRFGPDIILTLDSLHLSLDEARKMTKEGLIVQKMLGYFVYSKAFNALTPERLKKAYLDFCKTQDGEDKFHYYVLTFQSEDPSVSKSFAEKVFKECLKPSQEPSTLLEKIEPLKQEFPSSIFQLSSILEGKGKELNASLKELLLTLKPSTYSSVIEQKSRKDQKTVYRIYYLNDHQLPEKKTFEEAIASIRADLFNKEYQKSYQEYTQRLLKKYPIEKSLEFSPSFKPFSIQ